MTPLHPSHMRCKLILLLIAPLCLVNLWETEETLKFFVDQQGWGASGNWNSPASTVAEEFWIEFWVVFPVILTVSLKASSIPQPPLSEYHQMLVCLLTAASFFSVMWYFWACAFIFSLYHWSFYAVCLCCYSHSCLAERKSYDQMMLRCSMVIWEERANEEVMNGIHAYGNSSRKWH